MPDVLTRTQRSKCMRAIRHKDTKPELMLRKALWREGCRYRIKNKLAGRPDIVFPAKRVVVFIDGCFWHGCPDHFQQPETNAAFWRDKIGQNMARDRKNNAALESEGWTVIRLWEHQVKADLQGCVGQIVRALQGKDGRDG